MRPRIVDHTDPAWSFKWSRMGQERWNGAYYYSAEIVANIIPNVDTDRPWVTVNQKGRCFDRAVVFIHSNIDMGQYDWLAGYDDLVLVCGVPETCDKLAHVARTVYLPLSVDVEYVRRFAVESKDRWRAIVGRKPKVVDVDIPEGTDRLYGLPREKLLERVAHYREVYAVGRCAIEARALGCEVLPYDPRYPDPSLWRVVDNREAAAMLQGILDGIDGKGAE